MRQIVYLIILMLPIICHGQDVSWLIKLKPGNLSRNMNELLADCGGQCVSERNQIYRLETIDNNQLKALSNASDVLMIQPNRKLKRRQTDPNDPAFIDQYAFDLISVQSLWDLQTGGLSLCSDTIVLAIFDDDFDVIHEDLLPNIWVNHNEIPNNEIDDDNNGYIDDYYGLNLDIGTDAHIIAPDYHGTSVAGVAGAVGNNGIGMTGMNWNVKLLLLSSIDKDEALAIEAFEYLIELREAYNNSNGSEGAFVVAVNNSWGLEGVFEEEAPILCDMFNQLGDVGILSIGATENDQSNTDVFGDIPSDCSSDHLIVVTNTDENDELSVAAFGRENVDLSAPGESIVSLAPNNSVSGGYSGTSYASPLITGAIGLLYAVDGGLCNLAQEDPSSAALMAKSIILNSTSPLPSLEGRTVTGGRIDLSTAVDFLSNSTKISDTNIQLFPNPSRGMIQILGIRALEIRRIDIYNMLGEMVTSIDGDFSDQISILHLPSGQFQMAIRDIDNNIYAKRFVNIQ